ncbi:hypothetical protein CapIbe_010725 [Capra ibex]
MCFPDSLSSLRLLCVLSLCRHITMQLITLIISSLMSLSDNDSLTEVTMSSPLLCTIGASIETEKPNLRKYFSSLHYQRRIMCKQFYITS